MKGRQKSKMAAIVAPRCQTKKKENGKSLMPPVSENPCASSTSVVVEPSLIKDFNINEENTIKKLIKCSKKKHCIVKENLSSTTILLSAAAYLKFKNLLPIIFKSTIESGSAYIRPGKDGSDKTLDYCLHVNDGPLEYAVNLYNTTCNVMVNGRDYQEFSKHLPKIVHREKQRRIGRYQQGNPRSTAKSHHCYSGCHKLLTKNQAKQQNSERQCSMGPISASL